VELPFADHQYLTAASNRYKLMAGGLLTTLPLVLAFLFFQKQFIAGITAGAIKQ